MLILFLFLCSSSIFGVTYTKQIKQSEIPELEYLDKTVNPCDNFYKFTCENFKNVHPIPNKAKNWDHFSILQKEIHTVSKSILESERKIEDPIALQKAKAFYSACVNVKYMEYLRPSELNLIDRLGNWPAIVQSSLNSNEAILTWDEIGDLIADYGIPFYFEPTVTASTMNGTGNVIYISQDTLTNPDAGIIGQIPDNFDYLAPAVGRKTKENPTPYEQFLINAAKKMRRIAGTYTTDQELINQILDSVKYLRYFPQWGIIPSGVNITSLPREVSFKTLQAWTDEHFGKDFGLNWVSFFNRMFKYTGVKVNDDTMAMFLSTQLIYGILNLYKMSNSTMVKNYIFARIITHMASDLDEDMRQFYIDFYNAHNYTVYNREEYCIRKTIGYPGNIDFSMAVTYEYQKHHFNVNKLEKASEMIIDLQKSFLEILESAEWMDNDSRAKAIQKAKKIITLLAYPEYAEKENLLNDYYKNLKMCTWDHFGNAQRLRAFRRALNWKQIGTAKDREIWNYSPLEANAFYNRASNRILFPVSVLNPVFFNGDVSILDYARIGAIIGHEITHGFDKAGKAYDLDGTQQNWWTEETLEAFDERTHCFENQYNKYYIEEIDKYVNGTSTLNENLADNGGLRAAYSSFQKLRSRGNVAMVDEYTPDQLFFIGFGTMWCMTETADYLEQMHESQEYSPGRYRVNGAVSNMVEFSKAFNCPVDSNMNAEEKCVLW